MRFLCIFSFHFDKLMILLQVEPYLVSDRTFFIIINSNKEVPYSNCCMKGTQYKFT